MILIDTHSHLNFKTFEKDLDQIIKRCQKKNIWVINVGSQYQTSKKAIEIAENYKEGIYAAVGLHPIHIAQDLVCIKNDDEETEILGRGEIFNKEKYKELAKSKKVVAIGEIGLDYYYRPKTKIRIELFKEKQKEIFLQQIDLAKELDLPLILHCRMAHEDMIKIINSQIIADWKKTRGVIHCFTGSLKDMEDYLKLGLYIGFNGIIFKLDLDEAIKKCPLERILIETDCPYLIPPAAGAGRNEPIFIEYIAKHIAEIKEMDYKEIVETTTENARKLFRI